MVKVNVDAHLSSTYVGLGVVVRGVQGQLLATSVKRMEVSWEA